MGFLGFRRGVLRGILGRPRGANGRFYREIPGFLGGARVRRGDSAHGGHYRADRAKKFLKKGRKTEKLGARGAGRRVGDALHRSCGAIVRPGSSTSSSIARGAVRHQRFTPLIYRGACLQAPSLALWRCLRLSDPQFSNPHLWLESTHLPYPGWDHILSK